MQLTVFQVFSLITGWRGELWQKWAGWFVSVSKVLLGLHIVAKLLQIYCKTVARGNVNGFERECYANSSGSIPWRCIFR